MSVLELIRACAVTNDGDAWEEFVDRFEPSISLSIKRTARQRGRDPEQIVEDLLQETYLKLCADNCRQLLEFASCHPDDLVLAYIRMVAINVARDHFKSLRSQKRGAGEIDQLPEDFEPAARGSSFGGADAIEDEVFLRQVDEQLQKCAAGSNQERDCIIFWFHYLQGMSAEAIAAIATVKLKAKGVEAVISRLVRCLREQLGDAGLANSAEP
jgi:RNA polymerase sigma-70 factor (ECF subfamily)